jgi:hypothetical protein
MQIAFTMLVRPIVISISGELRRVLELLLGEVGLVALERSVVVKLTPRNRIFVRAHSKKPAELHDRVNNPKLLDHQPPDCTDLVEIGFCEAGDGVQVTISVLGASRPRPIGQTIALRIVPMLT